jgi:hypothetical protein
MAAVVSVTETFNRSGAIAKIQWTVTTHTDGTASLASSYSYFGAVGSCVTNPGATAPTDNWDLTITDSEGHDVLQGAGADRDTTNTETCGPTVTPSLVFGKLTANITNGGSTKDLVVTLYVLGDREPAA